VPTLDAVTVLPASADELNVIKQDEMLRHQQALEKAEVGYEIRLVDADSGHLSLRLEHIPLD
jgi:hypothetical protein